MVTLIFQANALIYYVTPTASTQSCPTDLECHTLSYYIKNKMLHISSNMTLIFMDGEHLLQENAPFFIESLHEVQLLGKGQWVNGFHWSVMESTVVIRCTNVDGTSVGINIYNTKIVHIKRITITDCNAGIMIHAASNIYLDNLSLQCNSVIGLFIGSTSSVVVTNSSFSLNKLHGVIDKILFLAVTGSNFSFSNATYVFSSVGGLDVTMV